MKKRKLFVCLAVLGILLAAFLLMGASCSASSANIQNAVMSTAVDEDGKPVDSVTEFAENTSVYASVELHNAPDDTNVTFVWYAGDQKLDSVTVTNTETDQYMDSHIAALPSGSYTVEVFVDEREKADATLQFTVK